MGEQECLLGENDESLKFILLRFCRQESFI